MDILELENVTVTYSGGKAPAEHISFRVPQKSIVAIVGESGSGKSTVLRAVMGLLPSGGKVAEGRILFEGQDLGKLSQKEMRQIRGKEIAMIFQNPGDYLNPRRKVGSQ